MENKTDSTSRTGRAPTSPVVPKSPSTSQPTTAARTEVAQTGDASGEKISGAELKKRKQADKAARRAAEKAAQGAPPSRQDHNAGRFPQERGESSKKGEQSKAASASSPKTQHKRTPSTQKSMPVRPIQAAAAKKNAPPKQAKQETKKVALFGHLYGQPRNTTIIGAGKDIHPAVLALGLQMSSYVVCGSSARCVAMLHAFKRVIDSYTTPPGNSLPRHLTSHLNAQIEYLVSCRPIATSMGNAIRWLKVEINDVDPDTDEMQAKQALCEAIDRFILERFTAADQAIADTASAKIKEGDVVLTFGKSHIVQQTLLAAQARGRRFRVIVVDARPLFEGRHLARTLSTAGIEVTYTLTHALGRVVRDAAVVMLGAHAMLGNGRLSARAGTACVALMARAADVPVIVCCESVKFTDKVALDAIVSNEVAPPDELLVAHDPAAAAATASLAGWRDQPNLQLLNLMFDVTPAEYITMVVTEYGSLPPTSVPVVHGLSTNT